MDRRQKKTREAIFEAFVFLLYKKDYSSITVKEIIDRADVGRATFYAHFETKDYLLKELCAELFCHIFDFTDSYCLDHKHIFKCDPPEDPFLHLLRHLKENDNNILKMFCGQNNLLFYEYFKDGVLSLVKKQISSFESRRDKSLPENFWLYHITSVFTETVKWWVKNDLKETPETIVGYFYKLV